MTQLVFHDDKCFGKEKQLEVVATNVIATVTTAVQNVPRDGVEIARGDKLTVGVDNCDVARSLILDSHHKHDGQLLS